VQCTDAQVRKMMEEMKKHGRIGVAAARAGMDRKTARKYVASGKLPSELKEPRHWRTRENPFEGDWPWIEGLLRTTPELEAKTVFEALLERNPGQYQEGQLRTLQRHIKRWRALHGPDKRVFFAQSHRPGEAMQTDFTDGNELRVTIGGEPFAHKLCDAVLPYSNWQWVTVCKSESLLALKRGVQEAVFRLGKTPVHHQTDNSTAATHNPGGKGGRCFNKEYETIMEHLNMKPRTTGIGEKEQNGDVESGNRWLKAYLKQQLLLRGSTDFASEQEYEEWLWVMIERKNRRRTERLQEELAVMTPLTADRLPLHREFRPKVSTWSTVQILRKAYSVPSRLIGERVDVRVTDRQVEVRYAGEVQLVTARLTNSKSHRVDYRHVIWSLVKHPAAFERYRYREEMFPTLVFRKAYDDIRQRKPSTRGDLEYLRILHLAAATYQDEVESVLRSKLDGGVSIVFEEVRQAIAPMHPDVPDIAAFEVDLRAFDSLLSETGGEA